MKRSYEDMITSLSVLPEMKMDKLYKCDLLGVYNLRVTKVVDISKPTQKPIEEIDEPEEEDMLRENHFNKNNDRMIQLDLKDAKSQDIKAIETQRIEALSNVKPNCIVTIAGPVSVRCSNIMLEPRHLTKIEGPFETDEKSQHQSMSCMSAHTPPPSSKPQYVASNVQQPLQTASMINLEDWPEDEIEDDDDLQVLPPNVVPPGVGQQECDIVVIEKPSNQAKEPIQVVEIEDWDEEDEEDECVILN